MGTSGHHRAPQGSTWRRARQSSMCARRCPAVPSGAQWCPSLEYISSHHWASMGTGGHQWAPQGSTWRRARQSSTCARRCPAVPSGAQWCPVVPITRVHQFPSLGIYGHRWAPVGTSGHHRAALGVVRDSHRRAPGSARWCPVVPITRVHQFPPLDIYGHRWAPVGTTGQHLASCATVINVRPAVPSGAQWCPVVPSGAHH